MSFKALNLASAWLSALALVLVALIFGAPTGTAAAKRGAPQRPPPRPLYWGAQIGDQLTGEQAPWDMNAIYKFEHMVGKTVSLLSFSTPFAECSTPPCRLSSFPTTPMQDLRNHGAIPFLNWSSSASPESADQQPYRLAAIIDGSLDSYIRGFAESARKWRHPFFLRFDWEMNGFWFPWSEGLNGNQSGEFVTAWRHVHDIFAEVGATNATWVWCPNVDFTRELLTLKSQYPGDDYVDWTCLDGFNWGKRQHSAGWQTFNEVFSETYRRVLKIAPGKPLVIGETASNEVGGSKPQWIRNLLRIVPSRYRKVRGMIWFDVDDRNTHWPVESSRKSLDAFSQGIRRRPYRPSLFGGINTSPIRPLTWAKG
jgi:Glycosyl hydrolase family 26